ncbi:MAG TPA: hypothetical protein VK809_08675 [Bacteroidia bacterium]|jgi:hypothetical protein|nr:hypothetical protein [Bacteroidia bacterium]
MKHFYRIIFIVCLLVHADFVLAQAKQKHSIHKSSLAEQYFNACGDKVKYAIYNTDTARLDSTTFVTHTAEYAWDTINSGYIFLIKEQRLFCDSIKPEVLRNDLLNIISIIPQNGFKLLDKSGGEFSVNIEEALYDGGEDSIFIAVDINGFIGGSAEFEESGVVGLRYSDLKQYNDSAYKRPDRYPMNRFGRPLQLR